MKGLCYLVLIIAFFIYYQQNPIFTVVIVIIGLGVYFYFKSRKLNSSGTFAFFSKHSSSNQNKSMEDLITFMMLQQILGSPASSTHTRAKNDNIIKENDYEKQIETIKKEVLDLLEDE
jgi:hypothetical protein